EFRDDLVDRRRPARDRRRAGSAAERAVALAVPGEIEIDDGNALALDIAPDVELGPMQQRMDAHAGAGRHFGPVLVPELGRLVADVPAGGFAPGAEHPLLGARAFLVAPDAGDDAVEAVRRDGGFQPLGLERGATGDAAALGTHAVR